MDPFEARLQFQQKLKTITSSNNQNVQITKFMLQNHELQEDFHSCILESLRNKRSTPELDQEYNFKVNILQLVETILQYQVKSNTFWNEDIPLAYVDLLIRDLEYIVRRVLSVHLLSPVSEDERFKGYYHYYYSPINLNSTFTIMVQISKTLKFGNLAKYEKQFKDIRADLNIIELPVSDGKTEAKDKDEVLERIWDLLLLLKQRCKNDRLRVQSDVQLQKMQSEQLNEHDMKHALRRMEDDRERTKKMKETIWEKDTTNVRVEFDNIVAKYNNNNSMVQDDFKDMVELNVIVSQCYNDWTKK